MSGDYKNYHVNSDGSKLCSKCGELKDSSHYRKYCVTYCYECLLKKNREKWLAAQLIKLRKPPFYLQNLLKEGKKECCSCNEIKSITEFGLDKTVKHGVRSVCKICGAKQNKKYEKENRGKINFNRRQRRKDPTRGIILSLRARQKSLFENWEIKKWYKTTADIREWLGCSVEECVKYIENKFTDGMNWNNRGVGMTMWQIDHKIPICLTEIVDNKIVDSELNRRIWHYTNLQPLWHPDNASKSNKYDIADTISMVGEHRAAS